MTRIDKRIARKLFNERKEFWITAKICALKLGFFSAALAPAMMSTILSTKWSVLLSITTVVMPKEVGMPRFMWRINPPELIWM